MDFDLIFCTCIMQHNQDLILASKTYPTFFSYYCILRNVLGYYCLFARKFEENQYSAFTSHKISLFVTTQYEYDTKILQKTYICIAVHPM